MRLPRRRFLFIATASALWAGIDRLFGVSTVAPDRLSGGLRGWVDTLLPRDAESPAASELQVHRQIMEKAVRTPGYTRLLKAGMRWADTQAAERGAVSFLALNETGREAVAAQAEAMGLKSVPGVFFNQTLKDARQFYYEQASSWAGVGFPHAPQPIGFTDYMEAPD